VPVRVVSDTLVQITLANGVQLQLPLNANVDLRPGRPVSVAYTAV
jgi:hypothetical protein